MSRFFAWVPVRWGTTTNTFKVEVEYNGEITAEALEEIRTVAKADATKRGLEVLTNPWDEVKVTRKP
jgi:hypothetical protein